MRVVLPGAVGAEVAEGTSPGDEELDAVHGDVVPEPLGQPVGLDGPWALGRRPRGAGGQRGGGHPAIFLLGRRSWVPTHAGFESSFVLR